MPNKSIGPGKWPIEFLPKPKPLTKKQQDFLEEVNKCIEDARKWKRI